MADGVDGAVDPEQPSPFDPTRDTAARIPEVIQLRPRHHAMLTLSESRQTCVIWCTVCGLILRHGGMVAPTRVT